MKRILLLFFLMEALGTIGQTPELDWVANFTIPGYNSNAYLFDIEPLDDGGIVLLASFYSSCDFDPSQSQTVFSTNGNSDIAVIKLDKLGHLVWARQIGGPGYDFGQKIRTRNSGEIYISGVFQDSLDVDPSANEAMLFSNGFFDGFLLILDENGNYVNGKSIGELGYDAIFNIEFDSNDECWISGRFEDSVKLNQTGFSETYYAPNGSGTFIAKVDSNLHFDSKLFMEAGEYVGIYDFKIDQNSDEIHYINYFSDSLNCYFSDTLLELSSRGSLDVVYGIMDSSGNNISYNHLGGAGYDLAYSLTPLSDGGFLTFFNYEDSLLVDINGQSVYIEGNGQIGAGGHTRNTAIVKFQGIDVEWFSTANVEEVNGGSFGYCSPYDRVVVDENDNIYSALNVDGHCTVNQPNLNDFGDFNSAGTVLSRQNSSGYFTGLYSFTGWGESIYTMAIEVVGDTLYLGFRIGGLVDFDLTEGLQEEYSHGLGIAKYIINPSTLETSFLSRDEEAVFPNPADIILYLSETNIQEIQIVDLSGRWMETEYSFNGKIYQINTSNLRNGVYNLLYVRENVQYNQKFIVQH